MLKTYLTGNLTRDPETKTTQSGASLCTFTVAASNGKDKTDFVRVTAWNKLGDICRQYLAKGRKVAITGTITASAYTDKNGEARASLEVRADDVEFLSKSEDSYEAEERKAIQQESQFVPVDEPLPF